MSPQQRLAILQALYIRIIKRMFEEELIKFVDSHYQLEEVDVTVEVSEGERKKSVKATKTSLKQKFILDESHKTLFEKLNAVFYSPAYLNPVSTAKLITDLEDIICATIYLHIPTTPDR